MSRHHPQTVNRAPIAGGEEVRHNLPQLLESAVTAPPLVGCVVWSLCNKMDHGTLLHKLRAVGITGNISILLFYILTDRSHFYGGISEDHHVLSGVPQGTVLDPFQFLSIIADIDNDVSASKLVSFADCTLV